MATDTRVYVVSRTDGTEPRLIRANNKPAAMRAAVAATFVAKLATQDDLIDLMARGIKVETATDQPEEDQGALPL